MAETDQRSICVIEANIDRSSKKVFGAKQLDQGEHFARTAVQAK